MKVKNLFITIIIALAAGYTGARFATPVAVIGAVAEEESVYDRVMRTGTLNCGWFVEPPFTRHDESTGVKSGFAIELTQMVAKDLGWEIDWSEQINFGTFPTDLKNGRYDMICGSIFVLPRNGLIDYTTSYATIPLYGYVRSDQTRFDQPFNDIDWSKVTVSGIDGEAATASVARVIPEAKITALSQAGSIAEMLNVVATGKADIAFVMPSVFEDFNKTNPGVLKKADLGKPLYNIELAFGVAANETGFKDLVSNAIRRYQVSGELEALYRKYDPKSYFEYPEYTRQKVN